MHPLLQQSLNIPQDLPTIFMDLQEGFVTQFSSFTNLQSLVLEKQCDGA